jgi:ABC-type cobalamin/Fe3+-siderophores transport system ATPase subunit
MTRSYLAEGNTPIRSGSFEFDPLSDESTLSNLVSVTFSAFDEAELFPELRDKTADHQYSYIGLKRSVTIKQSKKIVTKSPAILQSEFVDSVATCWIDSKILIWKRALETLEADPVFQQKEISSLASTDNEEDLRESAKEVFGTLSSGHKIVLLTITRLVETVEEKTLVLLDEPEAHLHPPLLSAFIRALSNLLIERNGVAIIATHSPVVLQEVSSDCVWKLNSTGTVTKAERLTVESFGENVGVLTREVFGLEVTKSGFHNLLEAAVNDGKDFEKILEYFNGKIGVEGKAILRMLLHARDNKSRK